MPIPSPTVDPATASAQKDPASLMRLARRLVEQAALHTSAQSDEERAEVHLLLQAVRKRVTVPEPEPKMSAEPQPSAVRGFPPPPISHREIFDTPEPPIQRHGSMATLMEHAEALKKAMEEREKNPPWEPRPLLPESEDFRRMLGMRLGGLFPIHPDDVEEAIRRGYIPKRTGEGMDSEEESRTREPPSSDTE